MIYKENLWLQLSLSLSLCLFCLAYQFHTKIICQFTWELLQGVARCLFRSFPLYHVMQWSFILNGGCHYSFLFFFSFLENIFPWCGVINFNLYAQSQVNTHRRHTDFISNSKPIFFLSFLLAWNGITNKPRIPRERPTTALATAPSV